MDTTCSESSPSARINSWASSTARSDVWADGPFVARSSSACSIRLTVAQPRTSGSGCRRSNAAANSRQPGQIGVDRRSEDRLHGQHLTGDPVHRDLAVGPPVRRRQERTDRREVQVECVLELAHAPAGEFVATLRGHVGREAQPVRDLGNPLRRGGSQPVAFGGVHPRRREPPAGGDHRLDEVIEQFLGVGDTKSSGRARPVSRCCSMRSTSDVATRSRRSSAMLCARRDCQ